MLRETERKRSAAAPVYFKALHELRAEAKAEHNKAIVGKADFAEAARLWVEIQIALACLYFAWFLPRRTGWGLAICRYVTPRLNTALWNEPITTVGFNSR